MNYSELITRRIQEYEPLPEAMDTYLQEIKRFVEAFETSKTFKASLVYKGELNRVKYYSVEIYLCWKPCILLKEFNLKIINNASFRTNLDNNGLYEKEVESLEELQKLLERCINTLGDKV